MTTKTGLTEKQINKIKDDYKLAYNAALEFLTGGPDMEFFISQLGKTPEEANNAKHLLVRVTLVEGLRDFYDFFDENNVIIQVDIHSETAKICYDKITHVIVSEKIPQDDYLSVRQRVERVAFMKAFEVLEKKLNGTV